MVQHSLFTIVVVLTVAQLSLGGPYSPTEPTPFTIRSDGYAEPLSWNADQSGTFPQLFTFLANALDANPARKDNPDRAKVLERIAELTRKDPAMLTPAELAGLATAELRVGQMDAALNRLAPRSRDRTPDFRILATLAHTHAVRGEWSEALRWHQAAFLDAEFPDELADTTPEQRAWLKRVERDYYRRWLTIHRDRATNKSDPATEAVFPLFAGVRFMNEQGEYEPGQLAATERAKLPADAVAIVQQLLLWDPSDTSLYWLLAELYAAEGKLRQAKEILQQCAWSRQYSNRAELMAHRTAVQAAVEKLPAEADPTEFMLAGPATSDASDAMDTLPSRDKVVVVAAVFGIIFLALAGLQLRAIVRRGKAGCGPVG